MAGNQAASVAYGCLGAGLCPSVLLPPYQPLLTGQNAGVLCTPWAVSRVSRVSYGRTKREHGAMQREAGASVRAGATGIPYSGIQNGRHLG
jgi:hypothetical protein